MGFRARYSSRPLSERIVRQQVRFGASGTIPSVKALVHRACSCLPSGAQTQGGGTFLTARGNVDIDDPERSPQPSGPRASRTSRRRFWLRRIGVLMVIFLLWLAWSIGGA